MSQCAALTTAADADSVHSLRTAFQIVASTSTVVIVSFADREVPPMLSFETLVKKLKHVEPLPSDPSGQPLSRLVAHVRSKGSDGNESAPSVQASLLMIGLMCDVCRSF